MNQGKIVKTYVAEPLPAATPIRLPMPQWVPKVAVPVKPKELTR